MSRTVSAARQPPLFDTHAHLISDDWEQYPPRPLHPDMPAPARTGYTVTADWLVRAMDEQGVATACVVQRGHLYGYDNRYIIDAARRHPRRLLPVVILDTQDPATPARLARMAREEGVRGLRMANIRPSHLDTAWISSPQALQVWKACADLNLPVALIFFHNQLGYTLPLLRIIAGMFPALPILVDHLGTLYGATQVELAWACEAGIEAVAMPPPPDFGIGATAGLLEDRPNVYFKFTEVNLENLHRSGQDPAQLVRAMADRVGAGRLVWGSDVGQSLRWSFPEKTAMARAAAEGLVAADRAAFLHDTAARLYGR